MQLVGTDKCGSSGVRLGQRERVEVVGVVRSNSFAKRYFASKATLIWRDVPNQRDSLEQIGKELGVKEVFFFINSKATLYYSSNRIYFTIFSSQLSDWYRITKKEVKQKGGEGLFYHFPSLEEALRVLYSDYPWESTRFVERKSSGPLKYWHNQSNLLKALERAEKRMGIQQVCKNL